MKVIRDLSGRAEHSPGKIWSEAGKAVRLAARGRENSISAIVLSGYQMGMMAVDNRMRPMTGMATILDTRPGETLSTLEPHLHRLGIYRRTGCPPFAQYQLARLWWMNQANPNIVRKCRFLLGIKEYIAWKLCGEIATEPSLASATQMMDIRKMKWDEKALELAQVDGRKLPPIGRSDQILGHLGKSASREMGLSAGIPVIPGVYDGGALALGLGVLERGTGVINLGTSAMYRICVDSPITDKSGMRLQTYAFLPGLWLTGAGVNNAGIAVEWFLKTFGVNGHNQMEEMARLARRGPEVPLMFPYLTGERDPRIGSTARGVIAGLRTDHDRGALALATLEGAAFSLRFIHEALRDNGVSVRNIVSGGGGTRMKFWMGLIASILRRPFAVSRSSQPGLVGCGIIGFKAIGEYPDFKTASRHMVGPASGVPCFRDGRMENRFARYRAGLADIYPKLPISA